MLIDINTRFLRTLELGAGIGMLGIVAARILYNLITPAPEIIAISTVCHPEVLDNNLITKKIVATFPETFLVLPLIKYLD